jgi:excisionase family DNA binding protein
MPQAELADPLLTEDEAAARMTLKNPRTLSVWRATKRYRLPYIRIGRLIRYRQSDVDKFMESRRIDPLKRK